MPEGQQLALGGHAALAFRVGQRMEDRELPCSYTGRFRVGHIHLIEETLLDLKKMHLNDKDVEARLAFSC